MRVALAVTQGPHAGREFTFDAHDQFIVGRSKEAHFRLPQKDPHFSRIHFMVEVNPPHCRLLDMRSTNGTYVNGKRVHSIDLRNGDRIQGGKTVLTVSIREETTASSPKIRANGPHGTQSAERGLAPPIVSRFREMQPRQSPPAATCLACKRRNAAEAEAFLCAGCLASSQEFEQTIPDYLLVRTIGRGAMGVVRLAVHQPTRTLVALKTIIPEFAGSAQDVQRFLREAEILKSLQHLNVVGFLDMGASGDHMYFAMEYIHGVDASRLARTQGPLSPGHAVKIAVQLLQGLEYAHQAGFVHRDIKPANVLLCAQTGLVKVADFGLARTYQNSCISGLTLTGQFGGTLAFMAPEQLTQYRDAKPAVDQYAAAATLYYMLTRSFVYDFPKKVEHQILMLLQQEPIPVRTRRAEVPDQLARVIDRGLQRDPNKRFRSVAEMRARLDAFLVRQQTGKVTADDKITEFDEAPKGR